MVGTSLPVLIFIIFMILKLCSVVTWSWWWVTAPLWLGAGLGGIIYVGACLFGYYVWSRLH